MKRYEEAKADYEFLKEHHGADCNDLTGGYVADEKYFELLRNPSKKNAYEHYCSLITYFSQVGFEPSNSTNSGDQPNFDNEKVCEIFRRNCDEHNVLAFWGVDISDEPEEE